jgi:hypothetical protein
MLKLSFYEQIGIVIPGALFLVGAVILVPLTDYVDLKNISLGSFGLFLLLSYGAGHAIAAVGNWIETPWWWARGGMPSQWVLQKDERLLIAVQKVRLNQMIGSRLQLPANDVEGLSKQQWSKIFSQIYLAALQAPSTRIETFNGNYGLNRGLAASFLVLTLINVLLHPHLWTISLSLTAGFLIHLYRMQRFAMNFAKEVLLTFINLPDV